MNTGRARQDLLPRDIRRPPRGVDRVLLARAHLGHHAQLHPRGHPPPPRVGVEKLEAVTCHPEAVRQARHRVPSLYRIRRSQREQLVGLDLERVPDVRVGPPDLYPVTAPPVVGNLHQALPLCRAVPTPHHLELHAQGVALGREPPAGAVESVQNFHASGVFVLQEIPARLPPQLPLLDRPRPRRAHAPSPPNSPYLGSRRNPHTSLRHDY
mmetsp:Transcript_28519/g.66669  ORF Transcript_28519/g.66669 Transcript_28519/m.66669 type:complete len:211 (+) Transcript_28519:114-746(+)